ncbi:hypothetical protein [Natronorubrum tibetense]|uniref:Uncharacterized protein n=1 Tax=Natronorubrum tibetense GA33 TaxID=1114856 RepID=L9VGL8_9EURY|nr:hypothetical protein [Natronorubrum tibetense]ELY36196.1 hypothetical protein C496_21619 [Natronorubrum tibetense GA33]
MSCGLLAIAVTLTLGVRPELWGRVRASSTARGASVRRWRFDERMAADEVPAAARDALEAAIDGSSRRD